MLPDHVYHTPQEAEIDEFGEKGGIAFCIANKTFTILYLKSCTKITTTNISTTNQEIIYTTHSHACTQHNHSPHNSAAVPPTNSQNYGRRNWITSNKLRLLLYNKVRFMGNNGYKWICFGPRNLQPNMKWKICKMKHAQHCNFNNMATGGTVH